MGKNSLFINSARKLNSRIQNNGSVSLSYTTHKNEFKMDYNLNIKLKMIKLLEENASFLTLVSAMIFFFAFSTKSRGNKIKNKEMGQITEYKASA